jgi:hypothetical protein
MPTPTCRARPAELNPSLFMLHDDVLQVQYMTVGIGEPNRKIERKCARF